MRILLLNDYATPTAGAELLTLHLRDAFRGAGHETRVLASRAELISGPAFEDISVYGTTGRLQPLSSMVNRSAASRLSAELKAFRPDVVQLNMFMWQLSPAVLALLADAPTLYYASDFKTICPVGSRLLPDGQTCAHRVGLACLRERCLSGRAWAPQMIQHTLWRRWRGSLDRVIAASGAVRDRLAAHGTVVDGVVWPGSAETSVGPVPDERPTLTYAGRLVGEKGVDALLRAFALLVRDGLQDAVLRIAGSGPAWPELAALARTLEIEHAVSWLGQLPHGDLAARLGGAWVHVVPSKWPEPFGLTGAEAMLRGTPVVVSEAAGLAELVIDGESGLIVPPGDTGALAAALRKLLSDRDLAARMGAAARARAVRYATITSCANQLLAHHEEMLAAERS